mgnify:CR=1 FL=1
MRISCLGCYTSIIHMIKTIYFYSLRDPLLFSLLSPADPALYPPSPFPVQGQTLIAIDKQFLPLLCIGLRRQTGAGRGVLPEYLARGLVSYF